MVWAVEKKDWGEARPSLNWVGVMLQGTVRGLGERLAPCGAGSRRGERALVNSMAMRRCTRLPFASASLCSHLGLDVDADVLMREYAKVGSMGVLARR